MDIYVFNKNFEMLGVIDTYESLIWRREYNKIGTFELHVNVSGYLDLLQKGNLLVKDNDQSDAVEIDTIELVDEGNTERVVVKGFSISRFLEDRFVWGTQTAYGTVENVMKAFVTDNAIAPTNTNRKIPNLVHTANYGVSTIANEVNSWKQLSELMIELSIKYDVGWRIQFDPTNKLYKFNTYRGKDSSSEQTTNPMVIFSDDYDNVYTQKYLDSDQGYKTMALVAGQGEGSARKLVTINDTQSGFARKELFIDARDISDKNQDGTALIASTYEAYLSARGQSKLAENQRLRTFEAGISVISNYVYRVDFDLGDKVTVENKKWSTVLNARIIAIEEVYENNTEDIRVEFGTNIPTLSDKLNKKEEAPIFTGTGYYKSTEVDTKITNVNDRITTVNGNITTLSERNYIPFKDTRSVELLPTNFFNQTFTANFARNTLLGSPTHVPNTTYSHPLTIAGWNVDEGSGGYPIQVSFGPKGLSIRQATSGSSWGAWRNVPCNELEAWTAPTLLNGYTNYGGSFESAGFYKDPMGVVHLKGLINVGAVGASSANYIFILPEGYRPAEVAVNTVHGTGGACRVDILKDGGVQCRSIASGSTWISLSNITFRAV